MNLKLEDDSRIRQNNAAQNVALLRKIALNLLKVDTTTKDTVRGKRLQATFDENHSLSVPQNQMLKVS